MDINYLRECFTSFADTGELIWNTRPLSHFNGNASAHKAFNTRLAGKKAGIPRRDGRMKVCVSFDEKKHTLYVSRIIWALHNGAWPKECIDHKNGSVSDNRIENLRECTQAENVRNRLIKKGKLKLGVYCSKKTGRFTARIRMNHENRYLGSFATEDEAHAAYVEANKKLFGQFSVFSR